MRYIPLQNEPNNNKICCDFKVISSVLLHLIFTANFVDFVDGGRKNVSCPRAQDTLATPLYFIESA